ncbi:MAG: AAA family ATPase [Tepidiformaceae bacterium]
MLNEDISTVVSEATEVFSAIRAEVQRNVIDQTELIDRLLIGLITSGHILVEGVPGLAKSLTVASLATALQISNIRIQFTPDLLPADLIGTEVLNPKDASFSVRKGPIFSNIVMADEINRAPAKVQSALLEAMEERQVSIGGETFFLPDPFLVIATQNPLDHEGTYPLPEAQLDRFLLKVQVNYPSRQAEKKILEQHLEPTTVDEAVGNKVTVSMEDLVKARAAVLEVSMDDSLKGYIIQVVQATRYPAENRLPELKDLIAFGASPRASIALGLASRAYALLQGRDYVIPEDIKALVPEVLRHRLITTYEADAEDISKDDLIERILAAVAIP